jgi:threonine synthase
MVKDLNETKGDAVIVDECETLDAFNELAKKGFFVEPSSAVAYAAYIKQLKTKEITKDAKTVIILTGTGLKTTLKPK